MKSMDFRKLEKLLRKDGWRPVRYRNGHLHYRHPSKPGKLSLSCQKGGVVPIGTAKQVLKDAQMEGSN